MVVQDDRHFVNRKAAYQYSRTPNVDCSPCKNEKSAEANQHTGFRSTNLKVRSKVHGVNKYQKMSKNLKWTDCKNMQ